MAENVAGKAAMVLFGPKPSITILTFWQGIVEIILRVVTVILAFIVLIASAVALNDLKDPFANDLRTNEAEKFRDTIDLSKSACSFLIFMAIMVMVLEGLIIAQRFLNFAIVDRYIKIFLIVDISISGVFTFLFFCLSIATAVYAGNFSDQERDFSLLPSYAEDLNEDMGAVSAFSFISLFVFTGLAVFMVFSLILRWRNSQAKYAEAGGTILPSE